MNANEIIFNRLRDLATRWRADDPIPVTATEMAVLVRAGAEPDNRIPDRMYLWGEYWREVDLEAK